MLRSVCAGFITAVVACTAVHAAEADPFADSVIAYSPAAGLSVCQSEFSDPARALGAPQGGGSHAPDLSSQVSLGGFGGTLVLGFDEPVTNDPANPFGLDAIVFGNAFWVGSANRRWAEAATIEIAQDLDDDGEPDGPWYLIPGSHLSNGKSEWHERCWDDMTPPAADCRHYACAPPEWAGIMQTAGYALPPDPFHQVVLVNPNGPEAAIEGIYGYADLSPTAVLGDTDGDNLSDRDVSPEAFYVVPDDPLTVGITAGSAGGDAFDIAWAIDPRTGTAAQIDQFRFIRLRTAVDFEAAVGINDLSSAEIDAVSDVAADHDCNDNGTDDTQDIAAGVSPDCNHNGVPDVCDIAWRQAPDENGDGIPDHCVVLAANPAAGAIDARQPHAPGRPKVPQGWDRFELTFATPPDNAQAEDFAVQSDGRAPQVTAVEVSEAHVTVLLSHPLPAGAWTTLVHVPSGVQLRWGVLPGDVNADHTAGPLDILALVDALNGKAAAEAHAVDINRSGLNEPQDILRLIDVLNGAGDYSPWLGRQLP